MFRKLFKIAGILVLILFVIVTLAFSTHESKDVVCKTIEIEFKKDELIKVDRDELIRIVKSVDSELFSKKLNQINTEKIELAIEKHQAILKAEVYTLITSDSLAFKGVLAVEVVHRKPLVRIMEENGSYYLDELGGKIPISSNYTANVLVTTGFFTEKYARTKLLPFVMYIENDEFWQAQIEQIHIDKNGNLLLTPLVGNHIIEFGDVNDFQLKLKKMKAFYEQVLVKNNWNKYKTVSLKYNNQVVAKRR